MAGIGPNWDAPQDVISWLWLNSSSSLAMGTTQSQGPQREGQTVTFLLLTLGPGVAGDSGKRPGE